MPFPFTRRRRRNRKIGDPTTPPTLLPGNVTSVTHLTSPTTDHAILLDTPIDAGNPVWPSNWTIGGVAPTSIVSATGSTLQVRMSSTSAAGTAYVFGATQSVRTAAGYPINAKSGTTL